MVGCSHNYVYTQGHFYCTKCGKRTYGKSRKKRQIKKISVAVTAILIVGIVGFLFVNGVFVIDQNNLEKTIQSIPQTLPDVNIQVPELPPIENLTKSIPNIQQEGKQVIPKLQEQVKQIGKPELDISKIELLVHEKINIQRTQQGLSSLELDQQISDIARMHSQDMAKNNYFSHTSLSGEEPWDRGDPYGYKTCGTTEALALQKKYDELSIQYEKYPRTVSNQAQYQQAMSLYNQLNTISSQLESLGNSGQLFGGLAENISQNWIYESILYVNGIPNYKWNNEEKLAEQTVNGWMNSPGHRKNILSGFHSEGIGVAIAPDDKVYFTENFC